MDRTVDRADDAVRRIAGTSGLVSGLVVRKGSEVGWRAMFAVGLLLGAVVYILATRLCSRSG